MVPAQQVAAHRDIMVNLRETVAYTGILRSVSLIIVHLCASVATFRAPNIAHARRLTATWDRIRPMFPSVGFAFAALTAFAALPLAAQNNRAVPRESLPPI